MDNNTDSENEIMKTIQRFRESPKSFFEPKELPKNLAKKKEYEDYINSLEKMPNLIFDENLCKLAEEELKKLSEDPETYNKYQIGEEFQANLSNNFIKNEWALIAIEELESIEKLISKIIINEEDKEKKGRKILRNKSYTHLGFCYSNEEYSIILIFAKKGEITNNINNREEEHINLSDDENKILNQIKIFRNSPKSLLGKLDIKSKNKKNYESFINSLDNMDELKLDKKLVEVAREEVKILSEDIDKYKKIQINEEFKPKLPLPQEYDKKNIALIAIGELDQIEKLFYKIIINGLDKEKKGRIILSNKSYTHFGFCKYIDDSFILIFAKKTEKIDDENNLIFRINLDLDPEKLF